MLGDGHLSSNGWSSEYRQDSKFKSHLEWVSHKLEGFGIELIKTIREVETQFPNRAKRYPGFSYASRSYVELETLHKKWYRKAREDEKYKTGKRRKWIKIVPVDLSLTPLTCLAWYLGDGHFNHGSKASKSLNLATQCFTNTEINFLLMLLSGLGFKVTRNAEGVIRISTKSTPSFFDFIGPCPVKCYEHRWNGGRALSS